LYSDPEIRIEWPISAGMELTLSEKDKLWGGLSKYRAEYKDNSL